MSIRLVARIHPAILLMLAVVIAFGVYAFVECLGDAPPPEARARP